MSVSLLPRAALAANLHFEGGNEGVIPLIPDLLAPHDPLELGPEERLPHVPPPAQVLLLLLAPVPAGQQTRHPGPELSIEKS